MSSSGLAMNGITVAARSVKGWGTPPPRFSVDGFAERPDSFARPFAQPVVVILQVFDHGLKIANSRPQSSCLQDQTIVPINALTQNCLGHTNSDGFLRACEGQMDHTLRVPRAPTVLGLSQSLTWHWGRSTGKN